MTTHVMLAVDGSGSMFSLADDVRGGVNNYITSLKEDTEIEYKVSIGVFNQQIKFLADNEDLSTVPELDVSNYFPSGGTALLDAIGQLVAKVRGNLKEDDRAIVYVQTDGQENSSVEYKLDQISAFIKELEGTGKWAFIYVGSGPTAWDDSRLMGFSKAQTIVLADAGLASRTTYSSMSSSSRSYARGASGESVADEIREAQED